MKEIGGYFGLEQLAGKEYYDGLIPLNNGRNGLLYLIKAKKIKKLYIPYFLCNSIKILCDKYGCQYEHYNIDYNFLPLINKKLHNNEYIYMVNYYGQISKENIYKIVDRCGNVILDNTQAFFDKPMKGIDTIYSCRKFFGVPDGGYLSTDAKLNDKLEQDVSGDRIRHLIGRYEGKASDHYEDFKSNEDMLSNATLKYMSELTHNIMRAIDYKHVIDVRNKNYIFLSEMLGGINKLNLIRPNGPFAYPFYTEIGLETKRKLAINKIYTPTLWPSVLEDVEKGSIEYDYVMNIIPVPCDQRYTIDDMKYITRALKSSLKLN